MTTYHDGKDTLFHLTRILSTKDNHLHTLEVDLDGRSRAHTLRESVGRELASIVDDEVRLAEFQEFRLGGTDQHVVLPRDTSISSVGYPPWNLP